MIEALAVILFMSAVIVLVLRRPKYMLYAFTIFAPFSYYYAYLAPNSYEAGTFLQKSSRDIFIALTYLIWLLYIFVRKETKFKVLYASVAAIAFLAIISIQLLFALSGGNFPLLIGLRNTIEFIPLIFIVPSFLAASDLKKIINIMLSLSLIVALLGLIQLSLFYIGFSFWFNETSSGGLAVLRVYSTLFNPNNLGIYLVTSLLLFLGLYINRVYLVNKAFSRLSMVLLAVCLFFTFSRGALLALLFGVTFLLFRKKCYRSILLSFTACLLIIFAVTIYNPDILFRYVRAFSSEGGKNEIAYRFLVIPQKGWEQMSSSPFSIITGMILEDETNSLKLKSFNPVTGAEKWGQGISMDNYYTLLLFASGAVPFITFMVLIYLLFKESDLTASLTQDPFYSGLIAGILSVFVSYIVLGFVTDLWNLFPSNFYFWFLAGILILANKVIKQERLQHENRD